MKMLNPSKSVGHDGIPPIMAKLYADQLAPSFTKTINNCCVQCIFPQSRKMADISPVFKKQDHLQKGNYRPVGILTTSSKLSEQQPAKQLQTHFEGLFNDYVSAYTTGYSCQCVLLDLIVQSREHCPRQQALYWSTVYGSIEMLWSYAARLTYL